MAIQDFFTDDDRERQAALTASWEAAQRDLASPDAQRRIRCALDSLPDTPDEDLSPRQLERRAEMLRSATSAQETAQDPELMAWLRAVVERLDGEPPTPTEPAALWDAARWDESRWS